jgi:hypothetical protein
VKSLPANRQSWEGLKTGLLVDNPAATPHARYVVLYEGEGTLTAWHDTKVISSAPGRVVVEAGVAGDIRLALTATDPSGTGNYIRDIHVVDERYEELFQAGLNINPDWLAKVQDLHTFRFMDWMASNEIFDASGKAIGFDGLGNVPLIDWGARPKVTDANWSHGVPVEIMVELSNRAGADMWVNMPVNASDDYIRGFATYVRDHLRPDLKVHVEFSNEVWNWGFLQTHYAQAQGKKLFGEQSGFGEWLGMRTAQMGQIWNGVFGEPATGTNDGRAIITFATQAAWHGLEASALETPNWKDASGKHIRAADYFDEYAITGYYYGTAGQADPTAKLLEWSKDPDGFNKAIAAITAEVNGWVANNYKYHGATAGKYGLNMVTYESGPHINTPNSLFANSEFISWILELNRRPELYAIEQQNYQNFRNAGGDLFMNYGIIQAASKWGSWGALERTDQAHSSRYDALMDYSNNNAAWWETGRSEDAFANAKYFVGGAGDEQISGTAHGFDVIAARGGNDIITLPKVLGQSIDGGEGTDTLRLAGEQAAYSFKLNADGSTTVTAATGSATLKNVEQVAFGSNQPAPIRR